MAVPPAGGRRPHSAAFDAASGQMYWTDAGDGAVWRLGADGSSIEEVASGLPALAGVAVGAGPLPGSAWLFWANRGEGSVQRAQVLSGELLFEPLVETIATPGREDVHSLAVDSDAGKVYWSLSGSGRIQRSNFDGTDFEEVVTSGLDQPEALALDVANGKIYWVDAGAGKVQRASLTDGGHVETLFRSTAFPQGVALDLEAQVLYWGDPGGSILRASMAAGGECAGTVVTRGSEPALFVLLTLGVCLGCIGTCYLGVSLLLKYRRHIGKPVVVDVQSWNSTKAVKQGRAKALENFARWAGFLRSFRSSRSPPRSERHIDFAEICLPADAKEAADGRPRKKQNRKVTFAGDVVDEPVASPTVQVTLEDDMVDKPVDDPADDVTPEGETDSRLSADHLPAPALRPATALDDGGADMLPAPPTVKPHDVSGGQGCDPCVQHSSSVEILTDLGNDFDRPPVEIVAEYGGHSGRPDVWCWAGPDSCTTGRPCCGQP